MEKRILIIEQTNHSSEIEVNYDAEKGLVITKEGDKEVSLKISDQKPFKRTVTPGIGTVNYFLLKRSTK